MLTEKMDDIITESFSNLETIKIVRDEKSNNSFTTKTTLIE